MLWRYCMRSKSRKTSAVGGVFIFIDRQEVITRLPEGWKAKAKNATDELREVDGAQARKKIIDDNQELWRSIKGVLAAVGHQKCWYCETADIRSDNAVDHFRPREEFPGRAGKGTGGCLRCQQL